MTKEKIIHQLKEKHKEFIAYISSLDVPAFLFSPPGKWTPGQHMEHICRSVYPVKLILSFPKWFSKAIFRKANRPSRKYEELVQKYLEKLGPGRRPPSRFIPGAVGWDQKDRVMNKLHRMVEKLCQHLDKYSEEEMDRLVLPHPLLGRVTLREMMYFTIYHVQHHQNNVVRDQATALRKTTQVGKVSGE